MGDISFRILAEIASLSGISAIKVKQLAVEVSEGSVKVKEGEVKTSIVTPAGDKDGVWRGVCRRLRVPAEW